MVIKVGVIIGKIINMIEIREIEQLKGKTIIDTYNHMDELWLKFSDGSFAVLVVEDISEPYGHRKEQISLNHYSKDNTDRPFVELGFITEDEWVKALREEEIEFEKYRSEQQEKEKKRIEEYELEQLRNLEEKYKNR